MGKFKQFMFRLPTLPKEWYEKLNQLSSHLGMTQWQVTILGYRAILYLGKYDQEMLARLAEEIKLAHPAKMNAPGQD